MTAKEHLQWSADRALEYFDIGDHVNAISSFISDVGKHDGTMHISGFPMTLFILEQGYERGREAFRNAMLGFAVKEHVSNWHPS